MRSKRLDARQTDRSITACSRNRIDVSWFVIDGVSAECLLRAPCWISESRRRGQGLEMVGVEGENDLSMVEVSQEALDIFSFFPLS